MSRRAIHLPQSCPESWAAMTTVANGRHCAACQQVVVDFMHMSDQELVAFLQQYPTVTCGRFRPNQLARPLLAARPAGWRRWLGAAATLLGLGTLAAPSARGQQFYSAGPVPASPAPTGPATAAPVTAAPAAPSVPPVMVVATPAADFVLINGVLLAPSGAPKAGVEVFIGCYSLQPDTTVITDAAGRFQVAVPRDSLREGGTISAVIFPSWGFTYQHAQVEVASTPQPFYQLQLQRSRKRRIRSLGKFR